MNLAQIKRQMVRQRCTCEQVDVCDLRFGCREPHETRPGRRDPRCPQHGGQITPWERYLRGWGERS